MSVFNLKSECGSENNLCRICFSETSTFLNAFETFIEDEMTLAAMFTSYLRHDMYPDDDLPEFICCDCIEEVADSEPIKEEWKKTLRHLVWRTRVLRQVEYFGQKENLLESRFKLPLRNLISEDEKNLGSKIIEKLGRISVELLNYDEAIKSHHYNTCQSTFGSENKLQLHMKSCEESYSHKCSVCSGVFFNSSDLNLHKNVFHNDVKCFPCGRCHRKFKSQNKLTRHIEKYNFQCRSQLVHGIRNNIENFCVSTNFNFSSIPKVMKSEKVGDDEESNSEQKLKKDVKKDTSFTCFKCIDFFASRNKILVHLKECHGSTFPVTCSYCSTGFLSKSDLGLHQYIHDKEFSCKNCKKQFLTEHCYKVHIKLCQEKIVLYKCNICDMVHSTKGNLKLHMSSHSLLRKYACDHCPKKYKFKYQLLQHVRVVHLKLKPHMCKVCKRLFSLKHYLDAHLNIHSEEKRHKCSLCDKGFKTKSQISTHMRLIHGVARTKEKIIVDDVILQNLTY